MTIKSTNDIVLDLLDFYKTALPNASMVPGSVFRDLGVDAPASQLALLYDQLATISNLQSLRLVSGSDLDKLAQNFGATRKVATQSSGVALVTYAAIPAVFAINAGNLITAQSGATFAVVNGISVDPTNLNQYKSLATKYQSTLQYLGITDPYAVEVSVQATTAGSAGNISQYALVSTTISGATNVTNVFPFTGGTDQETDAAFRNRVLSIFSGSNIGTALGYQNTALAVTGVSDAEVIGPGNPLMTRDGTVSVLNPDGTYTIISEGTGGKVDILILGTTVTPFTDTYIYLDQSNTGNPTAVVNDVVLGQIPTDAGLTFTQRRITDIANGVLPAQPVQDILTVTGSLSGSNFTPQVINDIGVSSGNYALVKDTGTYQGSPWAQDKFVWVSNQIQYQENIVKGQFNGQDAPTYSDILQIPAIQQNISITNENSTVSTSDRSMIQLLHIPATNVTRVFNANTGETYTITNQNVDGTGAINTTGIIQISGNTLPSLTDILQVDYTWVFSYDPYSDYDGKILHNNPRAATDSIDWGISNAIRGERVLFTLNSTSTSYTGVTKLPITSIVSANQFSASSNVVIQSAVPNFTSRLAINLPAVDNPITIIESIFTEDTYQELYNTAEDDGFIINNKIVINLTIYYNVTIVLPTDTSAKLGDFATITYNQVDTFNVPGQAGSFTNTQITIPTTNITGLLSQVYLDVTYIAATQNVLTAGITNFPIARAGNGFALNTTVGSQNPIASNEIRNENQTIQENGSNQLYITLSINPSYYSIAANQVVSVIDLNSGLEIWNNDFPGTVVQPGGNANYQLVFSGYNSPAVGDNVLVLYYADDITRFQPFTFSNNIICRDFSSLLFNFTTNQFYIPIHNFVIESGMTFDVIDTRTGLTIGTGTDGYISFSFGATAIFSSDVFEFSNVDDIYGKVIRIVNPHNVNNYGEFNIFVLNAATNSITIGVPINNLTNNQVSVIRIADGKELWNSSTCEINTGANLLELPATTVAVQGDKVITILFSSKNAHQGLTRLGITMSDQVVNTGVISVNGTTLTEVAQVIFTATANGLQQNVIAPLMSFLSINTPSSIPANTYLARVMRVQKVATTTANQVLKTLATFDVFGTDIANNLLYADEMILNNTLDNYTFILPSTTNNITNAPSIGDKLQITFYYATTNNTENVYFTKNGTLYTNNRFAQINQIYPMSGFTTSLSTRFVIAYFTQPMTGTRYAATYNYLAPKENERIVIQYNYNQLIGTVTFAIENSRPLNADVLVRAAQEILVDVVANIVISPSSTTSAAIVIQNVVAAITNTVNANQLNTTLSQSDVIAAGQAVSGVERIRIIGFNVDGEAGQVLTITAQQNQYLVANNITVNQESITVN